MQLETDILKQAWAYRPRACFAAFSGGDDSLASTHYLMRAIPDCRVLHINTGIGIERTRQYVRDTCEQYKWPLEEIRAKEDCGQDYDALVLKWGFPGPAWHQVMYTYLKERCIRFLVRKYKQHPRDKIFVGTGIRKDESKRRMRYTGREVSCVGALLWVNPLYHRTKADFMQYIKENGLLRNPVSELLGMSGECLCGAFAHKGEKALIKIVCPATAYRIDALEARVRAAGFNWGWEDRPPRKRAPERTTLLDMPLCVGCEK